MNNFDFKSLLPDTYQTQRQKAMQLAQKWEDTGLLEGLSELNKGNMAQLLENQAAQLVVEANRTNTSANGEEWNGVALPLVRRIFSTIAAKDFVSVQPMNMPSGLVFYLDFKYATSQPGFLTSQGRTSQKDSVFGVTDADKGDTAGTEGLYGAGRFGYTINDYTSSALQPGAAISSTAFTTASVDFNVDLNYNSEFSASAASAGSSLVKLVVSASALTNPDTEGVRAFTLTNSTGDFLNDTYQEFSAYNATAKTITFIVSGSTLAGTDRIKVNYHKQPTSITRGDFEEGKTQAGAGTEALDIPTIDLELRSEEIHAKTRKLKAQWTPEFAQDLARYQNIDAEAELTSMLSEYISQEIDFEILDMLIENAQTTEYWSTKLGFEWDGVNSFNQTAANAAAYNQGTWFQTLGTKMQKVSNEIHRLTMRGGANFAVVSPTVATILESIPGYAADTNGDQMQFAMGVQKVGSLNSRFQIYKNPYMTENLILMGYRGSQFLETGAVYSPYIPLMMTPLVYDPNNFTPRKGVMTRYAKKMLRPEFYGKIYVQGLNTL
jgi:hypothetical protein